MLNGHHTHHHQQQQQEQQQQQQQEQALAVAYAEGEKNEGGEGGGGMMEEGEEEGGAAAAFHDTVGMVFSHMFDVCTSVVQKAEKHTKQALQHMDQQLALAMREKKEVEGQLQALLRVLEENKRAVLVIYEGMRGGLEGGNEGEGEGGME
eukprot:evm.model.NODE_28529_length_24012_cov_13.999084.10